MVSAFGNTMLISDEHPSKACSSIVVSVSGNVMLVSAEHLLKAVGPIVVSAFGNTMLVSDEHPSKAPISIHIRRTTKRILGLSRASILRKSLERCQ